MALFGKKEQKGLGLANVIRCDLPEYLIWKWVPEGSDLAKADARSNAIRYDSKLRVKDGEVAVFVYTGKDGKSQDFIEGPCDVTLKTANLPVLSGIAGAAFGGTSPFQAEVYFINMAGVIQIKFGVPYFDVFDPRFLDYAVPFSCHGRLTFRISDAKEFVKLHRLINFDLATFQMQIKDAIIKYVKGIITNVPSECQIPVMQIEKRILDISDIIQERLRPRLVNEFGVTLSSLDISDILPDKDSEGYLSLKAVTKDLATNTIIAQNEMNIKNMREMQRINSENLSETLKLQRQELAHAQRMSTDSANAQVYQIGKQADVSIAAANALGSIGSSMPMGGGQGSGGFNPTGMMVGMAMGSSIGNNLMNSMNNQISGMQTPPPIPTRKFHIAINGSTSGPYEVNAIIGMIQSGTVTKDTMVWAEGMPSWAAISTVKEFLSVFPPMPPMPPVS